MLLPRLFLLHSTLSRALPRRPYYRGRFRYKPLIVSDQSQTSQTASTDFVPPINPAPNRRLIRSRCIESDDVGDSDSFRSMNSQRRDDAATGNAPMDVIYAVLAGIESANSASARHGTNIPGLTIETRSRSSPAMTTTWSGMWRT